MPLSYLSASVLSIYIIYLIYLKPTLKGVYTCFDRFLPNVYKIGLIYTLSK